MPDDLNRLQAYYEQHDLVFDPEKVSASFLRDMLSATTLDEDGAIRHLKERWHRRVTKEQLAIWRHRKRGPAFLLAGRAIFYCKRDLDDWAPHGYAGPNDQELARSE